LDSSAGGRVDPEEVADVLVRALSREEHAALRRRLFPGYTETGSDGQWRSLGQGLVATLGAWRLAGGKVHVGGLLLGQALRAVGVVTRQAAMRVYGIALGTRTWRASATWRPDSVRAQYCNGRMGLRRVAGERLTAALRAASTESCRLLVRRPGRGEKRRRAEKEGDFVPRLSLTASKASILSANAESLGRIGRSTWYRRLREECWQFRRAGSRRVDVCDICASWDSRAHGAFQQAIRRLRASLAAMEAGYWDRFDAEQQVSEASRAENQPWPGATGDFRPATGG
jgi:hypothetical protein